MSWITIDPARVPGAVGSKEMAKVQLLAEGTLFPQVSVSEKSPLAEIDEIESDALPMFRRSTFFDELGEPTA